MDRRSMTNTSANVSFQNTSGFNASMSWAAEEPSNTSLIIATLATEKVTKNSANTTNARSGAPLSPRGNSLGPQKTAIKSSIKTGTPPASRQSSFDRYMPRASNTVKPGGLAEACGVRVSRVLEFNAAPPSQRQLAAAEFMSQYAPRVIATTPAVPERKISTRAYKVLDLPGMSDEYYSNVLHWSSHLNVLALALGSSVYAWDPATSQVSVIAELGEETQVSALRWTDDTCLAVSTVDGDVQIWDAEAQQLLRTMRGRHDRVSSLSWNEYLLSSGGRDGVIWNHDVRIKHHKVAELTAHSGEVCGLTWRSDGWALASGGNDNVVNIWDARTTSAPRHQLMQHEAAVKALAWCPWHTNMLATGGGSSDKTVKLWNTLSGGCIESMDVGAQVTSLHWSSEYRELVGTMGYPTNAIGVWNYNGNRGNTKLRKQVEISDAHASRILHSTLTADGSTLVTCSADENLKFWNLFEAAPKRPEVSTISRLALGRV